jgi:hypothetical protein
MWNARRTPARDGQRRLATNEVAYRTASGGVVIATAPSGHHRPIRAVFPAVARRTG